MERSVTLPKGGDVLFWGIVCTAVAITVHRAVKRRAEHFGEPAFEGIDYERYYLVVAAFRRILERPPTKEELERNRHRLAMDPDFDAGALETALRDTDEYRRLVGLQKNTTTADLEGALTEDAVRKKVSELYTRVTGKAPDGTDLQFLYERYRKSDLNDAYITALVEQMAAKVPEPDRGPEAAPAGAADTGAGSSGTTKWSLANSTVAASRAVLRALGLGESDAAASPEAIARRVRQLAEDADKCKKPSEQMSTKDAKAFACRREREAMLESINYDEGEPMGSWTMPISRDQVLVEATRHEGRVPGSTQAEAPACATADQTSLIGTPIDENGTWGGMTLLDMPKRGGYA